jgi:hypothetical protein
LFGQEKNEADPIDLRCVRRRRDMTWLPWIALLLCVLAVLALGLSAYGTRQWAVAMQTLTRRLEAARTETVSPPTPARYDSRELAGLPAPVQRYFRAVLKEDQPIICAANVELSGRFNMSATGEQWKPFTSRQRVVTSRPGFVWDARVVLFPGLPVRVVDGYVAGQGQLLAKLLGLFTVADAHGGGELARGEFMRYFAEAAWYPTALLPSQGVRWQAIDDASAHATMTDGPLTLTLLFRFDDAGLIASVRAESRGAGVGKDRVMLPWECRLSSYEAQHDMLLPMVGEAAWLRPAGRRTYFVGKVKTLSHEFAR